MRSSEASPIEDVPNLAILRLQGAVMPLQGTHRAITVLLLQLAIPAEEYSFHDPGPVVVQMESCRFQGICHGSAELWRGYRQGDDQERRCGHSERPCWPTAPGRER